LFSDEDSCADVVKDETIVAELKQKEEPLAVGLLESSASSGNRVPVSALNRGNFVTLEEKTGVAELKVRRRHGSSVLPESLIVDNNSVCISAVVVNRGEVPISEVEMTCIKKDCHEGNGAEIPRSEQMNSFQPLFLNENEREVQDCKQNACISEETCHEAETLDGNTNTPDIKRHLNKSLIQVHGSSAVITDTAVVKDYERDDLGVATSPYDCVAEEYSKRDKVSMSLTQEVKESAAALLADEEVFNSPAWTMNYVSCPDIVYDRDTAPPALVCSEMKDCSAVTTVESGSPVLGSRDRSRKRRIVRMAAAVDLGYSSHMPTNSSFKVNHLIYSSIFFCREEYHIFSNLIRTRFTVSEG
jgi:hypothetical protein